MSIEIVREYLAAFGRDKDIMEFETSSATVELAAQAVGVEAARITKTLAFKEGKRFIRLYTTWRRQHCPYPRCGGINEIDRKDKGTYGCE